MNVYLYRLHLTGSVVSFWSDRVLNLSDLSELIGRPVDSAGRYLLAGAPAARCSTWRPAGAVR